MLLQLIIVTIILTLIVKYLNKHYIILSLCKRIKTTDGSPLTDKVYCVPGGTIFGNNFDILNLSPVSLFKYLRERVVDAQGKSYLLHFLFAPVYNVVTAEDADEVFQSQALITKGVIYNLVQPFLGEGLLISTDKKWHFRRKTLTPAFHFNILQTFLEIFKEESYKFLETLNEKVDEILPLVNVIPEFTLNNVCETALGVKLNNISGSQEYRHVIHELELILVKRSCNPLHYYPLIFYLFGDYKKQRRLLNIAHDFSSKIIKKKRLQYQQQQRNEGLTDQQVDEFGKKKRYAMLDTLLDAEAKGLIDHSGICDEVNTFMFEGYDTTSTCLIFTLFNLALQPDIQEKCFREVENLPEIAALTVFDFNKLDYLECVIKESLRLYPSVPFIGRRCIQETVLNGLILSEATQINVHIFDIMRDPKHFPDPLRFDPDRFLPENTVNRHPFAFVPFSAGPRNCIGQKFAMLEIKVLLVAIIKNFLLLPVTKLEDIVFENGMVLRTHQQVKIKLTQRSL